MHPGAFLFILAQQDFLAQVPVPGQVHDHIQLALMVEPVGGAGDHHQAGFAVEEPEKFDVLQIDELILVALEDQHGHIMVGHGVVRLELLEEIVAQLHLPVVAADDAALLHQAGVVGAGDLQEGLVHAHRGAAQHHLEPAQPLLQVVDGQQRDVGAEAGCQHAVFRGLGPAGHGVVHHGEQAPLAGVQGEIPGVHGALTVGGEVEGDGVGVVEAHLLGDGGDDGGTHITAEAVGGDQYPAAGAVVGLECQDGDLQIAAPQDGMLVHVGHLIEKKV